MRIYIDDDYKCYTVDDGTRRVFDSDFFEGRCPEVIEGYRFIPQNEYWTRPNGSIVYGETIIPWKPYAQLQAVQTAVDRVQLEADQQALELMNIIEELFIGG